MKQQKRLQVLVGALIALAVCASVILWRPGKGDGKPPPTASGYYTGPMKNKSGRNEYSTEDNKIVPPPNSAPASSVASSKGEE